MVHLEIPTHLYSLITAHAICSEHDMNHQFYSIDMIGKGYIHANCIDSIINPQYLSSYIQSPESRVIWSHYNPISSCCTLQSYIDHHSVSVWKQAVLTEIKIYYTNKQKRWIFVCLFILLITQVLSYWTSFLANRFFII